MRICEQMGDIIIIVLLYKLKFVCILVNSVAFQKFAILLILI